MAIHSPRIPISTTQGRPVSGPALDRVERSAVRLTIERVLREIPADLVQASLFGSRARGDARPDSDIDLLLVFESLPPDREPQAGQAESIADEVARMYGVPITVWSVSLVDLRRGNRTPMLVDALRDAVPLWWRWGPLKPVPFTPADAYRCARALLERVSEGSEEVVDALRRAERSRAALRARDDLVRMCTALLLCRGITRPRRGDAVRACVALEFGGCPPPALEPALVWARDSYGPDGRTERTRPPPPPNGDLRVVARAIDVLRWRVRHRARRLRLRAGGERWSAE